MKRSSPAKPAMKDGDVVAALHRERRELQGGDPSLGAGFEHVDVRRGDRQAHRVVEVDGGLVGGEAKVGGADLEQLAARPQAGQRQGRVGAAGDHEVDLRRQVLDQERHRLVDLRRFDDVVVVEHQDEVVVDGVQIVEQGRDDGLDLRLRHLQERLRVGAHARVRPTGARRPRRSRTARARCRAGRARATRSPGRRRTSSATSVVLPNPAGADTSVSAGCSRWSRRSRSRGRVTIAPRRRGACSLVSRRGMPRANHAFPARRRSRPARVLGGGCRALELSTCPVSNGNVILIRRAVEAASMSLGDRRRGDRACP